MDVELGLVDPHGRTGGTNNSVNMIPRSQYGKIAEIPSHQNMSKAIAIEICGATPGQYLISVSEHADFDYRITVSGYDGNESNEGNETQPVKLHAESDRTCHFRFNFRMAKGKVTIQWLDRTGHPLPFGEFPVCEPVPRA